MASFDFHASFLWCCFSPNRSAHPQKSDPSTHQKNPGIFFRLWSRCGQLHVLRSPEVEAQPGSRERDPGKLQAMDQPTTDRQLQSFQPGIQFRGTAIQSSLSQQPMSIQILIENARLSREIKRHWYSCSALNRLMFQVNFAAINHKIDIFQSQRQVQFYINQSWTMVRLYHPVPLKF